MSLLVDGCFNNNSALHTFRKSIRRVDRLYAVNQLGRLDPGSNSDRFDTGRRRPLPQPTPPSTPKPDPVPSAEPAPLRRSRP